MYSLVLMSLSVSREAEMVFDHTTSRLCADPKCKGKLVDSIINFGEPLPNDELDRALLHSRFADLCLVLGSSLRVSPANQIPRNVRMHRGKVVICK